MFELLSERLIVAADFKVDRNSKATTKQQTIHFLTRLCDEMAPLRVTIKVNTVARILGAHAIEVIHDHGLACFLDLKLFDIGNTLENDAAWISEYSPLMLTVAERIKPAAFKRVQDLLPDTLVLPVGPLTDMNEEDFRHFDEPNREYVVRRFFSRIARMSADGAICAPVDIPHAPEKFRRSALIITPAVKPAWSLTDNNSANALTPAAAIAAGAAACVVGRGITAEENMHDAAKRTLDEMEEAFTKHA